jgi:hypothetical protein
MASPVEVVQALVDAFNAKDAAAISRCFHSDATIVGPDGNVMTQGGEAIQAMYGQLFAQSPDLHVNIVSRMGVGNWVVDEEEASGIVFEGFPSDLHDVSIYHVRDGLIERLQILT